MGLTREEAREIGRVVADEIMSRRSEQEHDSLMLHSVPYAYGSPGIVVNEARAKAVEDAIAQAKQMASSADVKLGKLIYMSESTPYVPIAVRDFAMKAEAAAPSPTPISPGEQELTLSVKVVFAIQ